MNLLYLPLRGLLNVSTCIDGSPSSCFVYIEGLCGITFLLFISWHHCYVIICTTFCHRFYVIIYVISVCFRMKKNVRGLLVEVYRCLCTIWNVSILRWCFVSLFVNVSAAEWLIILIFASVERYKTCFRANGFKMSEQLVFFEQSFLYMNFKTNLTFSFLK